MPEISAKHENLEMPESNSSNTKHQKRRYSLLSLNFSTLRDGILNNAYERNNSDVELQSNTIERVGSIRWRCDALESVSMTTEVLT